MLFPNIITKNISVHFSVKRIYISMKWTTRNYKWSLKAALKNYALK